MHIVLTGGAGFVGSHVAERLVAAGHEVVIYDAFTKQYPPATKRRNVAAALGLAGCTLIEGDILEGQRLDSIFSAHAVDAIVHMAAHTGERVVPEATRACVETNVLGTHNVLERCRRHGVKKLVYVSSSAVYGFRREGPCKETDPTDRPVSAYGMTKKAGESLCFLAHHVSGLDVLCLRPFKVYGPRQRPDQLTHGFGRSLLAGEPVEVPGDGSAVVDLVEVGDVADAIVRAIDATKGFEVVNVGTGQGTTLLEFVRRLAAAFGTTATVKHVAADPAIPPVNLADTTRAERFLGWRPSTDLDEGLRRFAGWFRAEDFADEA
jgi:UDP-glucuronate 4-epimerase